MDEIELLRHRLHAKIKGHQWRVMQAREIVYDALQLMQNPYIALSGGKDSTVTASLVWEINPKVPAVYFDADCGFPETDQLLDRLSACHTIIRQKVEPFLDLIARTGGLIADEKASGKAIYKATVADPIEDVLHAYHFDGVFLGLRSDESEGRRKSVLIHGPLYRYRSDDILRCLPVGKWTYDDIWAYIVEHNIDYNRAYDRMGDLPEEDRRISYWAGMTKKRWGRLVFLREQYPELWNTFTARFPEARSFG